ncbi:MAG: SH3 domain-containing protein [Nitratireductor sp.]|nr:SH3 domain-containing protein [Nitratireductor sp.]
MRIVHVIAVTLLVATGCLIAQAGISMAAEPGYYKVRGVADGDVLNIREEPRADATIVGEFKPGARPVEVLEIAATGTSEWGRVRAMDTNGWVAMRFLEPDEVTTLEGTDVPEGLVCGGTEPFWDAKFGGGELKLTSMADGNLTLPLTSAIPAVGRRHRFALIATQANARMTAMLGRYESCSDGMSDFDYGWRIDLLVEDGAKPAYAYEGCCHLPVAK